MILVGFGDCLVIVLSEHLSSYPIRHPVFLQCFQHDVASPPILQPFSAIVVVEEQRFLDWPVWPLKRLLYILHFVYLHVYSLFLFLAVYF